MTLLYGENLLESGLIPDDLEVLQLPGDCDWQAADIAASRHQAT
jgi:hypothetical protein